MENQDINKDSLDAICIQTYIYARKTKESNQHKLEQYMLCVPIRKAMKTFFEIKM